MQYRNQLVRAMTYSLITSHNPAKLNELVNAELANGAVFCGGPIVNNLTGDYAQAVVYPEKNELVPVPDEVPATPAAPPVETAPEPRPSLEDSLRALGSDREGLSYDTHTPPSEG